MESALEYEDTLRKVFHHSDLPQFDLVYLGLGDDAHTASLMPSSDLVRDILANKNDQLVSSLFLSETNMYRITLTPRIINNSRNIIFLVTGANKATALQKVLEGQTDPLHYPAQLIHCIHGKTYWLLDKAAKKI
jgi:6-phosphogluconolactonase